jgi:hypothetical protein
MPNDCGHIHAVIKKLSVQNVGWELVPLAPGDVVRDAIKIRGFRTVKHEERVMEFSEPGDFVIDE